MAVSSRPPSNSFVAAARAIYNPLGFSKGYNFVLWLIFAGGLLVFVLIRLGMLDFDGVFCGPADGIDHAGAGECFYFSRGYEKIGIMLHLFTILPASFLVFFQFIPVIRHKMILLHRINGYIVMLLSLIGTIGALMIAKVSFGGSMATQTATGFISIAFIFSLVMGYINIKRLQIEQHRAWMLRAWFYASYIVAMTVLIYIAEEIITLIGGYYMARPCAQVYYMLGSQADTLQAYPDCAAYFLGEDPFRQVAVEANIHGNEAELAAAEGILFGPAMWLAFALQAAGVEIYLRLTPAETERLRRVSHQRQLEAGMSSPGSAGLTADRLGDAERWQPGCQSEISCRKGTPDSEAGVVATPDSEAMTVSAPVLEICTEEKNEGSGDVTTL